jgi:hypothetical protein
LTQRARKFPSEQAGRVLNPFRHHRIDHGAEAAA